MPATRQAEAAAYLYGGCDSYTSPDSLGANEVVMSMNTVCTGGIYQTRPGTKSLFCLPSGNLQGMTVFVPGNGVTHIVAAVDGLIYVSRPPFNSWRILPNITFSPRSRYVSFCKALQSSSYDALGEITWLDKPVDVLIMQDGLTRAAYWDGGTSRHLNPELSGTELTQEGKDETLVGLWMVWSNNRLWVSRGNRIFASDIGNPLKFTETQYLNEARAFYLAGECSGLIETPDQSGIIAFTETDASFIQSSIQDRTLWLATPSFQRTLFTGIGCVAPRSIVVQYGFIWWFSGKGLTNLNAALRQNVTSRFEYQDLEMFASKFNIGLDMRGICAGCYENFFYISVPSGDTYNNHTWAMSPANFEGNQNVWNSFWTGWRPVEWAKGMVDGNERVFFASKDYDDNNRIWEAFLPDRKDNGCDITCWLQTREHVFGDIGLKQFQNAEIQLREVLGNASFAAFVAGQKGGWKRILTKEIKASAGQVYDDVSYDTETLFVANRPQTRLLKTGAPAEADECNACNVESTVPNIYDRAFSMLMVWQGRLGVNAYVMFVNAHPDYHGGDCEADETDERSLNEHGCGALGDHADSEPWLVFTAGYTHRVRSANGLCEIAASADADSIISQTAATRVAQCRAQGLVNLLYIDPDYCSPFFFGSGGDPICGNIGYWIGCATFLPDTSITLDNVEKYTASATIGQFYFRKGTFEWDEKQPGITFWGTQDRITDSCEEYSVGDWVYLYGGCGWQSQGILIGNMDPIYLDNIEEYSVGAIVEETEGSFRWNVDTLDGIIIPAP